MAGAELVGEVAGEVVAAIELAVVPVLLVGAELSPTPS